MNYEFILALDPSGSFYEGKGTTGWCIMNCLENQITIAGDMQAANFDAMAAYWDAHLQLINRMFAKYNQKLIVVIEDYVLYAHKADNQINSHMETSKLIGLLQHHCWSHEIPYAMQLAAEVKNRWSNPILLHKRYIIHHRNKVMLPDCKTRVYQHRLDAIRHAVHYATFKNRRTSDESCKPSAKTNKTRPI